MPQKRSNRENLRSRLAVYTSAFSRERNICTVEKFAMESKSRDFRNDKTDEGEVFHFYEKSIASFTIYTKVEEDLCSYRISYVTTCILTALSRDDVGPGTFSLLSSLPRFPTSIRVKEFAWTVEMKNGWTKKNETFRTRVNVSVFIIINFVTNRVNQNCSFTISAGEQFLLFCVVQVKTIIGKKWIYARVEKWSEDHVLRRLR